MLRGTLYLYGKAWISAHCIGFIECLVITKFVLPCSYSGKFECGKSGEAVSKCLFYMGYHANIMQCMQPNFLLTGQVYPMHGAHSTEKVPFLNWLQNFFWLSLFSCFGMKTTTWKQDIVDMELLYCVINFELVWAWNKVAAVEKAKTCRLYPTSPNYNLVRSSIPYNAQHQMATNISRNQWSN